MSDINNYQSFTKEDAVKEYEQHLKNHNQGYFKAMESYNRKLSSHIGRSPFSFEGWKNILENDGLYNIAKQELSKIFIKDPTKQKSFERLLDNTRDVSYRADVLGDPRSLEGWGGGNAVYASSAGAFAMGATPFIIGGWLAAARSEEMFLHIDNQNAMRLEFEYNIDYMQIGDQKYFFPKAFRSGEIVGFNKLPKVDWVTPNTNAGAYAAPETWCGEEMFIMLNPVANSLSSSVKGNFLEVCKRNKHKFGIEPNCRITAVKYESGGKTLTQKLHMAYDIATGRTNERMFKSSFVLKNVEGFAAPIEVQVYMQINLDDGDFKLAVIGGKTAAENAVIKGLQFDAKVSNIANELTNLPTMGTDKYQFIRECEYRNYSKVSLNEYMSDNFRIGSNNNITYAAYATDKMLQYTLFTRELEAEKFVDNEVLDDSVDIDSFVLTDKIGGFINNNLTFSVDRFAPGLGLQDYKAALKTYLMKVLQTSETFLNLPASVHRDWIFLGYGGLITEFPEIKFENAAVNLDTKEGASANENFGFSVDTRCGFIDSIGRRVRLIANDDIRWLDRGDSIFGVLRTYSMEYPFMVYYPHAIRMFTAIDADNPNRTSIYIGGREFRGVFAGAAVQMQLKGVLDGTGVPINNFESQMTNAKAGYVVQNQP